MPKNEKFICFASDNLTSALTEIRISKPLQYSGFDFDLYQEKSLSKLSWINDSIDGHFILLQRDFPKDIKSFFSILNEGRLKNIPIIYELDDLLFELPESHPLMQTGCYSMNFIPMLNAVYEADLVTVSTQPIADYLKPFNPNIRVLPNYLIDDYWEFLPVNKSNKNSDKIIIGYIGGSTHLEDVKSIIDPLIKISESFPGRIHFEFWGLNPPDKLKARASVNVKTIIANYEKYAKTVQNQDFDILIAPLVDNKFNQAKSNIKFLEYSTLGAPGVFSNVTPFNEIVDNGINGLLASTHQEWFDYLKLLIESPEKRRIIAGNAQKTVKSSYRLSQHAEHWLEAYLSIEPNSNEKKRINSENTIKQKEEILTHIFSIQQNQVQELIAQHRTNNSKIGSIFKSLDIILAKSTKKIKSLLERLHNN